MDGMAGEKASKVRELAGNWDKNNWEKAWGTGNLCSGEKLWKVCGANDGNKNFIQKFFFGFFLSISCENNIFARFSKK